MSSTFATLDTVRLISIEAYCASIGRFYNRLRQLLLDGDIESHPGSTQNDCKSPVGRPKKVKVFKGTAKKRDLSENNINVASDPKVQNCYFNTIQAVSLDIMKPWTVTCPNTGVIAKIGI